MKTKTTQRIVNQLSNLDEKEKKYSDFYIHFIHQLIQKKAFNKHIHLSSTILKKVYGRKRYLTIINFFIDSDIIDVIYQPKKIKTPKGDLTIYARKFKLNFEEDTIKHIVTNQKLLNNIERSFMSITVDDDVLKQMKDNIDEIIMVPQLVDYLYSEGIIKNKSNILGQHSRFANYTRRGRYGRVFNSLVKTNKIYRNGLILKDGSELMEIDASNAQLLCLNNLSGRVDKDFEATLLNGTFYEVLSSHMGIDISSDEKRSKFKQKVYNTFIANTNKGCVKNSPVGVAMNELFPIISKFVLSMEGSKAGALQNCEANFFINTITASLMEQGIWVATIHDAIIIKQSDYDMVIEDFNFLSQSYFGFTVTTKVKYFNATHLNLIINGSNIREAEVEEEEREQAAEGLIYGTKLQRCVASKNDVKKQSAYEKIKEAYLSGHTTQRAINKETKCSFTTISKHLPKIKKELDDMSQDDTKVIPTVKEEEKVSENASNDVAEESGHINIDTVEIKKEWLEGVYDNVSYVGSNEITNHKVTAFVNDELKDVFDKYIRRTSANLGIFRSRNGLIGELVKINNKLKK